MALLQYLNTLPSRQRYTEESRNGCLLLKCCQEWTYLAPLGTADILLYSLENRILSLLHPSVYPQLSRQCTAISVITSVSPTANRGCETGKAFPRFISWKPTPFLTKHFYLWRVLGIRFTFLIFFSLCVCGGGDVYYVISCRIQVQLAILVCVWKDPQMLSRHGKNAALEKCMFRRINKSLSLLICRSTGQREVAVLRSFVSFQSRILCLQMSLRHRAGGFCTDSTSTWMRLHRRSSAGGANLSKAGIHPGSVPSVTLFMLFRQFYLISMK